MTPVTYLSLAFCPQNRTFHHQYHTHTLSTCPISSSNMIFLLYALIHDCRMSYHDRSLSLTSPFHSFPSSPQQQIIIQWDVYRSSCTSLHTSPNQLNHFIHALFLCKHMLCIKKRCMDTCATHGCCCLVLPVRCYCSLVLYLLCSYVICCRLWV